ncbi:MAG TPA: ABC transporter permease [Nocardioidaceae bacterium]|nr:ABC transporter permease [Nocardioidaceae bacterium]
MAASLDIAGKDLRQRLRDRSAIMLAIVVPLALAAIFGLLFGSAATPRPFDYAVVDQDGGPIAEAFTTDVLGFLEGEEIVTVEAMEEEEAREAVRVGDLDAAFVFPAGFSDSVASDDPVEVRVVGSVDSPTGTDVARSIARAYVADLNAARVAVAAVVHQSPGTSDEELSAIAEQVASAPPPVALDDVSAGARVLDAKTYYAAGIAVFFLLFTVQFGVSSLIDERSNGTLARLLAAPVRRSSILAGKLLTSVALGVVSLTVLVVATTLLLGAEWGDPLGVALLVIAGVLAGTGVTSIVASLAKTPEQAGSWGAVVAVTLGLLGGAFFPIQQSGSVLATASLITPHAWFLRGLGSLVGDGTVTDALPAVGALLLFALVTGAIAMARIGRVVAP